MKIMLKHLGWATVAGMVSLAVSPLASASGITTTKTYPRNLPPFDIAKTDIRVDEKASVVDFSMDVTGKAGSRKWPVYGQVDGSRVYAYVWPIIIDPSVVGFEKETGTLALAVMQHPDYDDAPGAKGSDWHTHWVVLTRDNACGEKMMKVVDIKEGAKPALPKSWPGLPILIDSPGFEPKFNGTNVSVKVKVPDVSKFKGVAFDGMTMIMRVHPLPKDPYLCTTNVLDTVSDNLSFPGKIE